MDKHRQIILEMLQQRGYTDIYDEEETRILATKKNGKRVCIFSNIIEKLNINAIQEYSGVLKRMKIDHGILVYRNDPTPMANSAIATINEINMILEVFHYDELQYNPTKFYYVPTMVSLTPDESAHYKKKYGVQLPKMKRTDPIARFYNYQKGDIIKIIQKDGTVEFNIVI